MYPCSSIRKEDLSRALANAEISFDELHVYKTGHSHAGLTQLKSLLSEELTSQQCLLCLVFFSPSCVEAVFSGCESKYFAEMIRANRERFRFVSIGPSTSCKLGEYADDELEEPSPQALEAALKRI